MTTRRYSCGEIVPSACVAYTGPDLSFLTTDEQPACDANINDVVDLISDAIQSINTQINLTNLNNQCLTGVPTDVDVKGMFQIQTDKICAQDAEIGALQESVADWNVANQLITINLGCLSSAAAPCQQGSNTYSVLSLFSLLASEICTIKAHLGI